MDLDDRVFAYVASADSNEARMAVLAADIQLGDRQIRAAIMIANELSIDVWRGALRIAAEAAQSQGQVELAATFRESWDQVEMAMQSASRALGIAGPLM